MFKLSIGNHMISSAIWDKAARVNVSKTNKIAQARRALSYIYLHIIFISPMLEMINFAPS